MPEFIDFIHSTALYQRQRALTTYMEALHRPDGSPEPSEADVQAVIDAVKVLGLTLNDVKADSVALDNRRKHEAIVAEATRIIDESQAELTGLWQIVSEMQKSFGKGSWTMTYDEAARAIADAQGRQSRARARIENSDRELKADRINRPRAFGVTDGT